MSCYCNKIPNAKQLQGGGTCLGSQIKSTCWRRSPGAGAEAAGHIASSAGREWGMLVFPGCFPLNSFWDPSSWMVPARLGAGLSSITCLWKIPSQTPTAVFTRTPNSVKLTIKHNHHAILSNDIIIFSQATREMLNISTGSKAYKQSSENPRSPYWSIMSERHSILSVCFFF